MVRFEQVVKKYGNRLVVDNLNLTVKKGELLTLIGPSGCGKTTTLKMANRLIEPTSGRIYVNGLDIKKQEPVQLRRQIGYVIQQIGLFPNMTIMQNITIVGKLQGWTKKEAAARAEELLNLVNMDPGLFLDRYPKELSGGQQQRIGVLRALAADPDIILMDEPFGALDPITREQLQTELKRLQRKLQKTIIFVTHDMDEALKIADKIVMMKDGKILQAAAPDEMLRSPVNEFVASFIGKERLLRSPDEVLVEDVMITDPITIEYNRGLAEALERMRKKRVDSLMVVDCSDSLLGVITIKDVQKNMNQGGALNNYMVTDPAAVKRGQTVRDAVYIMAEHSAGYLPVVDEHNKLQGLITRASLVDILTDVLWPGGEADDLTATDREVKSGNV